MYTNDADMASGSSDCKVVELPGFHPVGGGGKLPPPQKKEKRKGERQREQ